MSNRLFFSDVRVMVFSFCALVLLAFYLFFISGDLSLIRSLKERRRVLLQEYAVKYKSEHHFNLLVKKVSDIDYLLKISNVMKGQGDKERIASLLLSFAKKNSLNINFVKVAFGNGLKKKNILAGFDFSGDFFDVYHFLLDVSQSGFLISMKNISMRRDVSDGLIHLTGSWEVFFGQ